MTIGRKVKKVVKNKFWERLVKSKAKQGVVRRLSVVTNQRLHAFAERLKEMTERLSVGEKKCLLFVFVLTFGGSSIYITWKAIAAKSGTSAVSVRSIIVCPPNGGTDGNSGIISHGGISAREFNMVRAFHHYLDSLGGTASGMAIRDSLLVGRPGLVDSLVEIEKMYLQR